MHACLHRRHAAGGKVKLIFVYNCPPARKATDGIAHYGAQRLYVVDGAYKAEPASCPATAPVYYEIVLIRAILGSLQDLDRKPPH